MVNQYTGIVEYYDLLMTSGYYDYSGLADKVHSVVGKDRLILELGVGTGLLAEKYIEMEPNCDFTGIDFSPAMLKIAKKRLGNRIKLIEVDAVIMDLNTEFDAAISNGGVWLFIQLGEQLELSSHITDIEANRKGLENVSRHLRKGGLLLISKQKLLGNYEKYLPGGIVYSQFFEEGEDMGNYHTRQKNYIFKKDGEILAQDQLTITVFKPEGYRQLFSEAGFELQGTYNSDHFIVYKKR